VIASADISFNEDIFSSASYSKRGISGFGHEFFHALGLIYDDDYRGNGLKTLMARGGLDQERWPTTAMPLGVKAIECVYGQKELDRKPLELSAEGEPFFGVYSQADVVVNAQHVTLSM
jgi:hypothetical protein